MVGLYQDGSPGAFLPLEERRAALEALTAVDDVIELEQSQLLDLIDALRPEVVVKGKEHERRDNPERAIVRAYGGHLIFSAGEAKFSSADLIRRELLDQPHLTLRHAHRFLEDHRIDVGRLLAIVDSFRGKRVLVLGDLIVDEYIYCDPLGMSQEDPTIVVTPIESRLFTGGAGIVAGHMAGLGAEVRYLTITGQDSVAERSSSELLSYGVKPTFIADPSRPTTLKQRFRAGTKTLLRVSHLRSHDAGDEYTTTLLTEVERTLPEIDVVVFSDFNYGALPQSLVDAVSSRCRDAGIPYVADSQASSQVGDVSRFVGARLISATEREARLAVNDFKSGLQEVINQLQDRAKAEVLFVKLAAEGMVAMVASPAARTDSLPALNSNPVDVAGAGDALLASSTLALTVGATAWEAAYLGSAAAAIQVSQVGNVPLTYRKLIESLAALKD